MDTWAATAAGAYTLTENSLYTVEAFDDYLDHLTDRGVLSISRWVFDGLRLVSLAQEACARHGWNAADRLAVIQYGDVATFLLKRTPFDAAERERLAAAARDLKFTILYLPGIDVADQRATRATTTRRLIRAPDRQAFYEHYPLDVSPTTDDRPFFFHTTKLRSQRFVAAGLRLLGRPVERPVVRGSWGTGGLTALLVLLAISSLLIVAFIIGPLAMTSRAALAPGWFRPLMYFACLGAGFMLIEVALLQRFVLLLGHPVYSLTVTLLSLLLGTGIGSVMSRQRPGRPRQPHGRSRMPGDRDRRRVVGHRAPARHPVGDRAGRYPRGSLRQSSLMLPAGMLMGIPLPAGVRRPVDSPSGADRLGLGHQRRVVRSGSHARRLHRHELGFFDNARLRRGAVRGGGRFGEIHAGPAGARSRAGDQ